MKLLDLPPELLSDILELVQPSTPSSLLPLTLVHPILTSLAQFLLFRDVLLVSGPHVHSFRNSPALSRHWSAIRRLRFIPRNGEGGRSGVGSGVGTGETVEGIEVTKLLSDLKRLWEEREPDGGRGGIEALDVASVDSLRPELLTGDWLSSTSCAFSSF
jgi:hypothetical protein